MTSDRRSLRRVAVLGTGGMGTVMALLFARQVPDVRLWGRDRAFVAEIAATRRNPRHLPLPEARLPENVLATPEVADAVDGADLIVAAIPSKYLRATLDAVAPAIPPGVPALSVIKGIELGTFRLPSEIVADCWGPRPLAVLSGPSHAEEIVAGKPTTVVVAGDDHALNVEVRETLTGPTFRVYSNPDRIGVELSGALKNVMGIAAGLCDSLESGDNIKSSMLTRALAEIARFVATLGGDPKTAFGLAGLGDLLTTSYSGHGRNRRVGLEIGRAARRRPPVRASDVLEALPIVAEGVTTSLAALELAERRGIDAPLTREVVEILYRDKSPEAALADLMARPTKDEWE